MIQVLAASLIAISIFALAIYWRRSRRAYPGAANTMDLERYIAGLMDQFALGATATVKDPASGTVLVVHRVRGAPDSAIDELHVSGADLVSVQETDDDGAQVSIQDDRLVVYGDRASCIRAAAQAIRGVFGAGREVQIRYEGRFDAARAEGKALEALSLSESRLLRRWAKRRKG